MFKEVPDWVGPYAKQWMDTLMLAEWRVRFRISTSFDNEITKATCDVYPNVREAIIELRDDIDDKGDEEWKDTIVHELLHVRLGSMTDYVEHVLLPALPGAPATAIAESAWIREMEATVEILTQVLRDKERNASN